MSLQKINTRTIVVILMIVAAAAFRLISFENKFLSNFTPLGAMAIFGGVYFTDKWKAYLVVLLSFVVSDIIIDYLRTSQWTLWSNDTTWYCLCFLLIVFVGTFIKKINVTSVLLVLLAPVAIHWLIMDLPWIYSSAGLYPKTLAGYGASLMAAIPFEKNMLYGDIVFGAILFGGFEFVQSKYTILRSNKKLAV